MNDQRTLDEIVETAFKHATENPSLMRWESCSVVAGCAAVRIAADGDLYSAAQLEGVADEARRQMKAMMPKEREDD